MTALYRHFLIVGLMFIINSLNSQDIFCTISGEIDNQKVGLESILIVNTTNNSQLLFENLSEQSDYVINLTNKALWGSTGLSDYQFENGYKIVKNTFGELIINVNYTPIDPVSISIYNIQGQELFSALFSKVVSGNSINIKLANEGVYLVKIASDEWVQSFRSLGSINYNAFSANIDFTQTPINNNPKSSYNADDSDFSFEIGDGLRAYVFKSGYWEIPKQFVIYQSVELKFELNANNVSGTVSDTRDGQSYKTIEIGNQTWFAENLNYETIDSWWYDNSSASGNQYGRLYTWNAAVTACPSGWHLPSDGEWTELVDYLTNNGYRGVGYNIGKAMASSSGWNESVGGGNVGWDQLSNNISGFGALPAGYRNPNESFYFKGSHSMWWSSNESLSSTAWRRIMAYDYYSIGRSEIAKIYGHSIRCLKD